MMQLIQFDLMHLDENILDHRDVEFNEIMDYEIARESICNLIFRLSRQKRLENADLEQIIENNITKLIYIRDHLQLHDQGSIRKIMIEIRQIHRLLETTVF